METRRKMKLSTSDKVLLGFGYAVLGIFEFVLLFNSIYCNFSFCNFIGSVSNV